MKRWIAILIALLLLCAAMVPVSAANGKVTYNGNAKKFIFAPGSDYSPTDLFPNFKSVMPGDTITQNITVKNEASNKVKVKIYMRSLGAHRDSEEFLSQLQLQVKKSANNKMPYMFDAAADQKAGLRDWVLLGTLYSGGTVDLDVLLTVPTSLTNEYQEQIGYLDWEFKIEEFPIDNKDPKPPQTGDAFQAWPYIVIAVVAVCILLFAVLWRKKEKDE